MENAVDALKMAAAVLVFVLALSICINAFGETRRTAKAVLDRTDRAYDYDFDFAYQEHGDNNRIVGIETIIPSIYKAYKENYKIVFKFNDDTYLYQKNEYNTYNTYGYREYKSIDLQIENIGNETDKEKFITALLYGSNDDNYKKWLKTECKIELYSDLNPKKIYDIIKDRKFKEYLGVYYQEDIDKLREVDSSGDVDSEDIPDANKTKKRVITYVEN